MPNRKQLIDDVYSLYNLFENYECLCDFIKAHKLSNKKRGCLLSCFEDLKVDKIEEEIDLVLDFNLSVIRGYVTNWQLVNNAKDNGIYQSNIFDFIKG